MWSVKKFGIENINEMNSYLTTVVPAYDVVSKVDKQAGTIQNIPCYDTDALSCHSITQSACVLWELCGYPSDRNLTEKCSPWAGKPLFSSLSPF